jgi:UDP-N-acetyl-2-amino-2-deoxyglucuronate dehydrogenase
MEKIKFAIIGLGHIGKRHAAILSEMPEAIVIGGCDLLPRQALALPNDFDNIPVFADFESLLKLNPDIVCICTPNGLHATHALAALRAGAHVVIEKPMALTKRHGEEVLFESLQQQKMVFCVMQNRYSPPAVWLKEVVASGVLGDIRLVDTRCYWNRDARYYLQNGVAHSWKGKQALDGGVLFTQFSHFVDMVFWLFGDIDQITAREMQVNQPGMTDFADTGLAQFAFVKGGFGQLSYTTACWDANVESSMTIIGSKGTIQVGGQYMDKVLTCHIDGYTMPQLPDTAPPNDYGGYKGSAANHLFVFENVIATLQGKAIASTNALEGLKVVEMIERIQAAAK